MFFSSIGIRLAGLVLVWKRSCFQTMVYIFNILNFFWFHYQNYCGLKRMFLNNNVNSLAGIAIEN